MITWVFMKHINVIQSGVPESSLNESSSCRKKKASQGATRVDGVSCGFSQQRPVSGEQGGLHPLDRVGIVAVGFLQ